MKVKDECLQQIFFLFIANRTQLRRAAYKILGDWDRVDDVLQDVYLKICEHYDQKSEIKQPLAYLFQVVRNMAIDQYRRANFEMDLFAGEDEGFQVPDKLGTPETTVMYCQSLECVAKALSKLPERTKRVFELYRIDGYTHQMIAKELNISISLVNILIHQATRQCKDSLTVKPIKKII